MNPNPFLQRYMNSEHTSVGAYTFYYIRLIQLLHFIYIDRINCDDLGIEYNQLDPEEITAWLLQDYQHSMDNGSASEMAEKIIELFFIPGETPDTVEPLFIPHLPAPYILTDREVLALYLCIHDERTFPFLSTQVRDKLQQAIEKHPFYDAFKTIQENAAATHPKSLTDPHILDIVHRTFRTIIEGTHTLAITTADGQRSVITPCHLRYYANTEEYCLMGLYNEQEYTYIPVKEIQAMTVEERTPVTNRYTVLEQLLKDQAQTLQLRVTNDKNALERAYHLFADYTKETTLVETIIDDEDELQDHMYNLTITYYPFDEEDIYQKVLSLSLMVTVLEPSSIRERVVEHFTALLGNLDT